MVRANSTPGEEKCCRRLAGEPEGKRQVGGPRCSWKGSNIVVRRLKARIAQSVRTSITRQRPATKLTHISAQRIDAE
jgi:hypothetical protein